MWRGLEQNEGYKALLEIINLNIQNFKLKVCTPALSLDQLIETNSAAHRLDALQHVRSIVRYKIEDAEQELAEVRRAMSNDTGDIDGEYQPKTFS